MNQIINHLPQTKQDEFNLLTELLSDFKVVEMVILFGSYARGNWIEDRYVEKGITYEYKIDISLRQSTSTERTDREGLQGEDSGNWHRKIPITFAKNPLTNGLFAKGI